MPTGVVGCRKCGLIRGLCSMPVVSHQISHDIDNVAPVHPTHIILVYVGLIWTLAVTLLRSIRTPNDWAEAHWLISYQFGFIKRGLAGTFIKPILLFNDTQPYAEQTILIFSTLLLITFCIVLCGLCFSIIREHRYNTESVLVSFIFLSSPFIVMIAHLNGYFDNILLLITIWSIVAIRRNRLWGASVLLTLGILVHESICLVGIPSAILAAIIHRQSQPTQGICNTTNRKLTWHYILPLTPPVSICVLLFGYQSVFVDSIALMNSLHTYLLQFPFIEDNRNLLVPAAFANSFIGYLRIESSYFLSRISNPIYLAVNIPGLLIIILYTIRIMRSIRLPFTRYAMIVPLLPLLLHMIAWDTSRIWTYPIVIAMLTLWTIHSIPGTIRPPLPMNACFVVVGILVAIWQLNIHVPLMDYEIDRFTNIERIGMYIPAVAIIFYATRRIHRNGMTKNNAP